MTPKTSKKYNFNIYASNSTQKPNTFNAEITKKGKFFKYFENENGLNKLFNKSKLYVTIFSQSEVSLSIQVIFGYDNDKQTQNRLL